MNLASKDISDDFPNYGKIYLNNASVGLLPQVSIDAINEFLISYNSLGPDSASSESLVSEKLQSARKTISKIIHCQPDEVILTQSTTDGINIVANGISFSKKNNVIIRGMSHEHHANLYPWLRLKDRVNLKSLSIDDDGFFDFDEMQSAVDQDTKLVALSHALYNTGAILQLEKLREIIGDDVLFFVDSAQTVGCVGDYDFSKIGCDFMSFNGSKWLCGPMGTGLFFCKRKASSILEPATIGGESAMLYEGDKLAFKEIPDKFQTGFRNYVGVVGMDASARYLLDYGLDNIRKKNMYLADMLRDGLSKIPGVALYGPEDPKKRTSIVSFSMDGHDPDDIVSRLEKKDIVLAVREILDTKIVRASPHFFNSDAEIQTVIDQLRKL